MRRKSIFIILILTSVVLLLIQYLLVEPSSKDFVDHQLTEGFNGYIAYKNDQKGFYLYLTNDAGTVEQLHLDTIYESEAFNKPTVGEYIEHIIFTDSLLYRASHLGDKIEKLPKSNKCLLITKEATFRFNCYVISRKMREMTNNIEEWQPNEIGLWKQSPLILK